MISIILYAAKIATDHPMKNLAARMREIDRSAL
jgi:hypothetical protein